MKNNFLLKRKLIFNHGARDAIEITNKSLLKPLSSVSLNIFAPRIINFEEENFRGCSTFLFAKLNFNYDSKFLYRHLLSRIGAGDDVEQYVAVIS